MRPAQSNTPQWIALASICFAVMIAGMASAEPGPANSRESAKRSGDQSQLASVSESMSVRFSDAETKEVPDFQKHVMPLLGRLGCNGRSCHGSFQGRGGFQLSLFGYDFKADHAALLDENSGRVDVDDITESLILAKPIDADMHEGGKRLDEGSWQFNTLYRWIESGAVANASIQTLDRLEIQPAEIQFDTDEEELQLTAIAHWADGTVEDVTELCRFSSNDDAVAAINENGLVHSGLSGDTHVVVSYDRAVVPIAVTRRVQVESSIDVPPRSEHPVDQLIAIKHAKLGIIPSPLCNDSEFIRRASLDITGTLPAAEEVRRFLVSDDPNKRNQLIEDLLDAPGYAAWWATRISDWTGNSDAQLNNVYPMRGAASRLWYEWLRVRLDDNVPYDEIVEGIVNAQSRQEGEDYREYCKEMTQACMPGNEEIFAARDGMPLFWARRNFQKPEERAIGFAYAFLGIRIECAQCHKHPFDQWSKDDFDQFAKIFQNINARANAVSKDSNQIRKELLESITDGKKLNNGELRKLVYRAAQNGQVVPFPELTYVDQTASARQRLAKQKKSKKGMTATIKVPEGFVLGQAEPVKLDKDPRSELMRWMRDADNPYFAPAIVNRVWSNYFGVGIINPTDDMNLANPASNQPLLEYLSTGFRDSGFDLRWLHREIVTSHAYQRSTLTNASNARDRLNFSRHVPRRLPAEVIHDAVLLATQSTVQSQKMRSTMSDMAIAADINQGRNQRNFALQVFGQSERESNCDCDRSDSPSLLQSIYLRNDIEMYQQLASKNGWVAQACASLGEAGPAAKDNPIKDQIARKADQARLQTIARVKRYLALNENRRESQRPSLEKNYVDLKKRLKQFGFETPSLRELLADPDSWQSVSRDEAATRRVSDSLESVIEDAYLRALSRTPDQEELAIAMQYINDSESVADGLSSVMWALVNTKEFIITH
ncbi:DUF1549 and DUF1553 domain-containing protein [Aporhodopirellula aestuarii]|uniref:DUF1549 and DUF1553 domain-containing protein n=1 Tax=Aporhodopirellula aestuarii TaxID=2950107 RepID=A0ABT0TX76_9BACT|nr:DUF1549 and DUF1553 domain-containing protein [Aporhodopirellula aestuarii]MCM2369145.1 DUF1549 and DUF1553 domain-containing protein [Aporhodopirellula aestuarii]